MESDKRRMGIVSRIKDLPNPLFKSRESVCSKCFEAVWLGEMLLEEVGLDLIPLCIDCTKAEMTESDIFNGLSENQREEIQRVTGMTEEALDERMKEAERQLRSGQLPNYPRRNDP